MVKATKSKASRIKRSTGVKAVKKPVKQEAAAPAPEPAKIETMDNQAMLDMAQSVNQATIESAVQGARNIENMKDLVETLTSHLGTFQPFDVIPERDPRTMLVTKYRIQPVAPTKH